MDILLNGAKTELFGTLLPVESVILPEVGEKAGLFSKEKRDFAPSSLYDNEVKKVRG